LALYPVGLARQTKRIFEEESARRFGPALKKKLDQTEINRLLDGDF
jgi:hypothetical protein